MIWQPQGKPNQNVSYLQLFGNGDDKWSTNLPSVLRGKSIYIYHANTDSVNEIPYSSRTFQDGYRLGFDCTPRPEGIYTGDTLRVIIADRNQVDAVYAWIAKGGQMVQMDVLPKPPPPSLTEESGGVRIAIPDSYTSKPVLAWYFWHRESGTSRATYVHVPDNKSRLVTGLRAGRDYDFGMTLMNQGGKSPDSEKATIRCI